MKFTAEQLTAAIEAEVLDWARFFDVPASEEELERRRLFHRANLGAGHLGALKPYLNIFPVYAYLVEDAIAAIGKLAKKAERFGTEAITVTVGETFEEERRSESGRKYKVQFTDLHLSTLAAPKVGDFTFVAKIERTEAGNIIDCVPGESLPERYRTSDGTCEHCRAKRDRKDLFVVREGNGTLVQVGRTCLRDFMGTDTPASVAARFRFLRDFRAAMEEEWSPKARPLDTALELLAVTAVAIRLWGWVPKSAPESAGLATAFRIAVWFNRTPPKPDSSDAADLKALMAAYGPDDEKMAQTVLEWVAASEDASEYMWNLKTILKPGMVEAKRRGYAASAVAAYQRHLGRLEVARREAESASESTYFGAVGQRLKGLELRCVSARGIETNYGGCVIYKLTDQQGNVFSWFSSGGADMDPGADYTLDATVKAHAEYKGVKETQLTRGKVL